MATINQSPAGQASVTLSGITFNGITATATPVRIPARFTVEGASVAVNPGGTRGPLAINAITLLDAPGDNAVSLATMAAAKITSTRNERLVAVSDPSPGNLAAVEQDGMSLVVVRSI
jgi:hypothetical protein